MNEQRKQLRRSLIKQRLSLSRHQQLNLSQRIAQQVVRNVCFLHSQRIALYFAANGEVDPSFILQRALAMGKECFFPILHPLKHNELWFGHYQPGDPLEKNYLDILEPSLKHAQRIEPWTLDLVITPLVGFDDWGHRLGMGGGFYDRSFAFKKQQQRAKPTMLGLSYELQHVPELANRDWDVPLDMAATENRIYVFGREGGKDMI